MNLPNKVGNTFLKFMYLWSCKIMNILSLALVSLQVGSNIREGMESRFSKYLQCMVFCLCHT
jgi:hypothetical protein